MTHNRDRRSMQSEFKRQPAKYDCINYRGPHGCLMTAAKVRADDVECVGCPDYEPSEEAVESISDRAPSVGSHGVGEGNRRSGGLK